MYKDGTKSAFTFHQRFVYNSNLRRPYDGAMRRGSPRATSLGDSLADNAQYPIAGQDLQMPVFKRSPKQPGLPVFRATCPVVDDEAITLLDDSWQRFKTTVDGKPDESIVQFKAKCPVPADFIAFDVEKYLTERLLKDVNLDPKMMSLSQSS